MATTKKTTKKVISSMINLDKSTSELKKDLQSMSKDLLESKKSHKAGEMVNPKSIGKIKKNIARILTKIRQDEINSQKGEK